MRPLDHLDHLIKLTFDTDRMFMSVILERGKENQTKQHNEFSHHQLLSSVPLAALSSKPTKRSICSTQPHLRCTEGASRGGKPGLVPRRDLLLTWLQLNYSRRLDPDLLSGTTLLAADLATSPPRRRHIRGHLRAGPSLISNHRACPSFCSLGWFPCCRCCWFWWFTGGVWRGLPSSADIIFPVLQQKVFELGDVCNLPT